MKERRKQRQKRKSALPLGKPIQIGDVFGDDRQSLTDNIRRLNRE